MTEDPSHKKKATDLTLTDGSTVAVVGGGPAGAFFGYFSLEMATRADISIHLDIYEPRDFSEPAPHGCNMCGGVVSESLVQMLAADGIELPSSVVQRGIGSYVLHMDVGTAKIETPLREKRIAAVHRGSGPRSLREVKWGSFDGFLLGLAEKKGAKVIHRAVEEITIRKGRPGVVTKGGGDGEYDLVVIATGINTSSLRLPPQLGAVYKSPSTVKTAIFEYYLGEKEVERVLGSSMHVFLLDLPRLEFAAAIPKGEYVTVCLLGEDIDRKLVESFLESKELKDCLPPDVVDERGSCKCSPRMNVGHPGYPFADRVLFLGDCGVTRLYKDGIGAAYRTAKVAAATAVLQGISSESFKRGFWPSCRAIRKDNSYGKIAFALAGVVQKKRFARRALLRAIGAEQKGSSRSRHASRALWDIFTGSAPYKEILLRMLHPGAVVRIAWNIAVAPFQREPSGNRKR